MPGCVVVVTLLGRRPSAQCHPYILDELIDQLIDFTGYSDRASWVCGMCFAVDPPIYRDFNRKHADARFHSSEPPYQSASETGWRVLTGVLSPTTISAHQETAISLSWWRRCRFYTSWNSAEFQAFHDYSTEF